MNSDFEILCYRIVIFHVKVGVIAVQKIEVLAIVQILSEVLASISVGRIDKAALDKSKYIKHQNLFIRILIVLQRIDCITPFGVVVTITSDRSQFL